MTDPSTPNPAGATGVARLRVGVLRGGGPVPGWQVACLNWLLGGPGTELVLVVEEEPECATRGVAGGLLFRWFWRYALRRSRALAPASWSPEPPGAPHTRLRARGGVLDGEQLDAVRACAVDLLLDFSDNGLGSSLASLTRLGAWSIQFGELHARWSGPPCFHELLRGEATVAAHLVQRLPGGGSQVLYQGHVKAFHMSYARTCDHLLLRAAEWPAQQAAREAAGLGVATFVPGAERVRAWRVPSNVDVARVLWRSLRASMVALIGTLGRAEQWHIGVIDAPLTELVRDGARPPVRWLPALPRGWYVADPFGVTGSNTILAEAFNYREAKGYITALDVSSASLPVPLPGLFSDAVHLSYPYLIEEDGQLYCIPERSAANDLILYRIVQYPHIWAEEARLLDGFPAVDATAFQHDGAWWLFATMSDRGYESTLYLWHAPALRGPWTPHRGNPVKTDVRSSRPAGMPFTVNGELYRPAQDCSRTYGGAVKLLRITALGRDCFAEEVVATVGPWPDTAYPAGLHTLTLWGDRTLVDAKRLVFTPAALWQVARYYGTAVKRRVTPRAR